MKKILDLMAAACLVFGTDWDRDFEDDEYVIACREEREHVPAIRVIETGRTAAAS